MSSLVSLYAAMAPVVAFAPAPDLDRIAADARALGFAEGEAAAAAALTPERAALTALSAALAEARTVDPAALRQPFVQLVTSLAEAVVMAELALAPAIIARLVDAALASVGVAGPLTVRLHPDDIAALPDCPVAVMPDAELARGSVAVEAATFVIHDGLAARLADVLAALP